MVLPMLLLRGSLRAEAGLYVCWWGRGRVMITAEWWVRLTQEDEPMILGLEIAQAYQFLPNSAPACKPAHLPGFPISANDINWASTVILVLSTWISEQNSQNILTSLKLEGEDNKNIANK